MTEITDLSPTDASNTSVTSESLDGSVANMGRMDNTLQAIMGLLARSIRTNVMRILDNTDDTKKVAFDLSGLTTATTRTLTIQDASGTIALNGSIATKGHIYGLTLSNNGTDATNDIDIAAGEAASLDSVPVLIVLASALTKRLDAAWAVGTNQGMRASGAAIANTTYHLFLIRRPDTGVVDVAADTSPTGANIAANTDAAYTQIQRIGPILREGGAIVSFTQIGDTFLRAPSISYSSTSARASAPLALGVPTGIPVIPKLRSAIISGTAGDMFNTVEYQGSNLFVTRVRAANTTDTNSFDGPPTDTSGQIEFEVTISSGTIADNILTTFGWIDERVL